MRRETMLHSEVQHRLSRSKIHLSPEEVAELIREAQQDAVIELEDSARELEQCSKTDECYAKAAVLRDIAGRVID